MTLATPIAQRFGVWLPAVVILTWLFCGAIYLTLPPSPDQFEHSYMGWRLLEGEVPYRDFIDMNWPGVMWMHALSTAIFGNTVWSWRAMDFIFVALSAFFLQDLVRRSAGRTAAAIALLLYPLFYASLPQWFSGQHDMSASQFLLASLWFHVRAHETRSWRWQIGAGALLALAMLNKPTVGAMGVLLMLHAFLVGAPIWRVFVHTATAAAAAVATLLVAFLALLAQGAHTSEIFEAVYTYNVWTQFLESATLDQLIGRWTEIHVGSWHYLSVLAAAGGIWLLRRSPREPATLALPVLWLGGLASFLLQQRGFTYHLAPCFIPVIGLASVTVGLALEAARSGRTRPWTATLTPLLLLLVIAGGARKLHTNYPGLLPALRTGDYALHTAKYHGGDDLTFAEALALTRRITHDIPAGETVLVAGTSRAINFLSQRRQSTRFFYAPVLFYAQPPMPMAERWATLFENDIRTAMPRLCLIGPWERRQWLGGNSRSAQAMREFLAAHYRKTGAFGANGTVEIYERQ